MANIPAGGVNPNHPWQSIVPQHMPWMSQNDSTTSIMHFGNQSLVQPTTNLLNNPSVTSQSGEDNLLNNNINNNTLHTLPTNQIPTLSSQPVPHQTFTPYNNVSNFTSHQQPTSSNVHMPSISGKLFPDSSLTFMPMPVIQNTKQKRSSLELDEGRSLLQPPSKQLLSEMKLFKKFGSLKLDGVHDGESNRDSSDDEDDCDHFEVQEGHVSHRSNRELRRYVYLLFKETNNKSIMPLLLDETFDVIARQEREKLSKAVIPWTPPLIDNLNQSKEETKNKETDESEKSIQDSEIGDAMMVEV